MRDIKLHEGPRVLILEPTDINPQYTLFHTARVEETVTLSRAKFDVIIVNVSTRLGRIALPLWLRDYPLKPRVGEFGNSFWIMEKDFDGVWIQ